MVKQHLISQVLLRQFANPDGQLFSHSMLRGRGRLRAPAAVAWSDGFVSHDPASTEALWGEVEQDLARALGQLKSSHSLTDDAISTLKDTVALHYLRRLYVRGLWDDSLERRLQADVISERVARHFPHLDSRAIAAAVVSQVSDEEPAWFQENVTSLFAKSRAFAASRELSVFEAVDREFLIGDSAVLSFDSHGRSGRIAFSEAFMHVLPVSPTFLIALSENRTGGNAGGGFVSRMNQLQVAESRSHVFFSPGHALTHFVDSVQSPADPVDP